MMFLMDMVIIFGEIRINIKDNFSRVVEKEVGNGRDQMDSCLKDNINLIKEMDMEFISGLMAIHIRVNSKMIIDMD